jgi:hypothetical protein
MTRLTIPTPSSYGLLWGCFRTLLGVRTGDMVVIYDHDDTARPYPHMLFCVDHTGTHEGDLCGLATAIRTGTTLGRPVVRAVVSCGGVVDHTDITESATTAELSAVGAAIAIVYAQERNPDTRTALRAIYRHLNHALTGGAR